MTRTLHLTGWLVTGGLAALLVAGCFGPAVLKERTEHRPASDPKVELRLRAGPPADVLVLYDEYAPQTDKTTRRAFWLFANEARLGQGKRPAFVDPGSAADSSPIPILKQRPAEPQAVGSEFYAVSAMPLTFDLQSRGHSVAEFTLPEYGNWLTAKKVFLFPLAAGADAVGAGAAIGAAGAVGAAKSGVSTRFP